MSNGRCEGPPRLSTKACDGPTAKWGRRDARSSWLHSEQYDHEPAIAVVRFWLKYSGRAHEFAGRIDERMAAGYRARGAMERHLRNREVFVGSTISLADIALYAYTHVAPEAGFELSRYPRIQAWIDRVAAVPGHVPIDA